MNEIRRANLFTAWAQLLEAGIPHAAIVEHLKRASTGAAAQQIVDALAIAARDGEGAAAAFSRLQDDVVPRVHREVLAAAERSGHVGEALRGLAADDRLEAEHRAQLLRPGIYPVFMFHFATLAPNAGGLVTHPLATLLHVLLVVLPIDFALVVFARILLGTGGPSLPGRLGLSIPYLARSVRARDHARYFRALHRLYEAGVPIRDAVQSALPAVGSEPVRAELADAMAPVLAGDAFALMVSRIRGLESDASLCLTTAEPSGALGDGLDQAASLSRATWIRTGQRIARVVGHVLYGAAVIYAVARIAGFWSDYFSQFSKLR